MEKVFTTANELANTLKGFKGASLCSIELTTKVKMNKKSRVTAIPTTTAFKGDVYRSYKEAGMFGVSYENAVNNTLKRENKENDFKADSLPWGEWFDTNKIIAHKNEFYLRYYVNMSANSKADKGAVFHYEDGTPLTSEEIALIPEYTAPKRTSSGRQGTDKAVEPRTAKMSGINKIKVGGVTLIRG